MTGYTPVPPQVDLPELEAEVLEFWHAEKVFEKSVALNEGGDLGTWTFYEGPPTANGRPGTHHIESRTFKDVFPRFKTMQGYQVNRKGGWDCHGLPVELAVEKELGFTGKADIEAFGIAEFNARCRESVQRHVDLWEQMTDRMGCWIDMRRPYRTMDSEYVQSVWWALKEIHSRGLLVQDYRVAPYCPRDETGLSDHEVAQGYETVTDPSVYVRFPLTSGTWAGDGTTPGAALLVWTTTPWTLVSNTAVAVRPDVTYVLATDGAERLVVAEPLVQAALGDGWTVEGSVTGAEMERWTYQRPFELVEFPPVEEGATAPHVVVLADYVTTEDGTGLVHQSPAFGADDMEVCRSYGLPVVVPVRPDGHFADDIALVGGQFFKHADADLVRDLESRGLMFRHQPYEHSYPHCWRCHTALMYYAQPSWYVRTTEIKDGSARAERADQLVPGHDQARSLRRLAAEQHRLGTLAESLLGHPAPDLDLRREPRDLRGVPGRALRADRHRPVGPGPAPALRRRHRPGLPHVRAARPPRAGGDRRLVRLRFDAVRAVGLPPRRWLGSDARAGLPGRLHL